MQSTQNGWKQLIMLLTSALTFKSVKNGKRMFLRATKLLLNAVITFGEKRGPKFWITAAIAARLAYSAANEHGMNPFKKDIKSDHVFLTGASGNVGKELALRLGKIGCKLSLCSVT